MKVHPAAALFPMLDGDAYAALLNDIREHGQREPVRTWNGTLLDGRNRWRACEELGVDCAEDPFHGTEQDAIDLVLSLNLHRRHLDAGQRACVAVEVLPLYQEIAAKAREETQGRPKAEPTKPTQSFGSVSKHDREAATLAAKATGANRQYVADAKALKAAAPEDFDAVKRGEMTLPQAKKKNAAPKPPREEPRESMPTPHAPEPQRHASKPATGIAEAARAAIARWSREATDDEWQQIVKALDDADTARAERSAS